ncbi:MAG TPA: phospholipase D-like domain-containing protein [Chitinophagales bacterium]|nr:phospholipase D-like domain-containing protein [Chitinophagales bacterium]
MTIQDFQIQATLKRWKERSNARERNLRLIAQKKYFDIDTPKRVAKFLARRGFTKRDINATMKTPRGFPTLPEPLEVTGELMTLERVLGTNDLVGVAFLQMGLNIAKTVGRIWVCNGTGGLCGYGTGFMISPSLLITNHHVLTDKAMAKYSSVEFNYQIDTRNALQASEIFKLDPDSFYFTDQSLDYAIVAVLRNSNNNIPLRNYSWNKLYKEEGKTIVSQWLNIIQHPNGEPKQIGLRENQLIDVLDNFLHYRTDTAPGSSGSPVFNERWEVVGLHHSGVPATNKAGQIISVDDKIWSSGMGEDRVKWVANEGIRITSILNHLEKQEMNSVQKKLYQEILLNNPMEETNENPQPPDYKTNPAANEGQINSNGVATWTIPISISVKIGDGNLNSNISSVRADTPMVNVPVDSKSESSVLNEAKSTFKNRTDVLNVRMGYLFENGWVTRKRAVVITVLKRKSIKELTKNNIPPLPETFMGYPIEITGPTFEELIAFHHGFDKLESLMSVGEEIKYFPPTGAKLEQVNDTMRVVAHVSPEEGWKNLSLFLDGAKKSLTVAMYDFGAKHILAKLERIGKNRNFQKLDLTIQPGESVGEGTKADDLTDQEIVDSLENALGTKKFDYAWIKIGRVNGWVSSSYHIKVAVRDHSAVWLSSGNWQSSNQPNLESDNLKTRKQKYLLNNYNREWHAIIEHKGLAQIFEKFIEHDLHENAPSSDEAATISEDLYFLIPESASAFAEEMIVNVKSFPPKERKGKLKVTPLLTPDNFFDEIIKLVNSAEEELLIQNQTFNAPGPNHEKLQELISAVLDKQKSGVNVKIIFRVIVSSVARKNIEGLVDLGFDPDSIRLQKNCHTKGVIVDGKRVALGSQNWSNDGVSVNRDASFIFDDEELAKYFREIFYHDWENLALHDIGNETLSLELTEKTEKIPPAMRLVSWKDIQETL